MGSGDCFYRVDACEQVLETGEAHVSISWRGDDCHCAPFLLLSSFGQSNGSSARIN